MVFLEGIEVKKVMFKLPLNVVCAAFLSDDLPVKSCVGYKKERPWCPPACRQFFFDLLHPLLWQSLQILVAIFLPPSLSPSDTMLVFP